MRSLHEFFESTTIHGLAYLTNGQSKSTRFIWLIIVTIASSFAGFKIETEL